MDSLFELLSPEQQERMALVRVFIEEQHRVDLANNGGPDPADQSPPAERG